VANSYQYQTFNDAPGMVDSLAKLRAMHLPVLVGKSFLDVGCNEGYYCGVALRAGAKRVVGLDSFALAIERASKRFPEAEFVLQSWETLPDESFDVIMLASAMHYLDSDDKIIALLSRIRTRLKDDGLFILEAGISPKAGKELVKVERHDGSVFYPTWEKLVYLVNRGGMVWRKIGESERGDNHPRIVMHCRKIRPVVMFIRGSSMSGKSYLANSLGNYAYWRILHTDEILEIAFKAIVPDFHIDREDWPSSLKRAVSSLPPSVFSEVASFLVEQICDRSLMIANNNLPRQDPVLVDGFDAEDEGYEIIFKHLIASLDMLGYIVWDARLHSAPNVDRWNVRGGYVDCGGFLLPPAVGDDAEIKLTEISLDHNLVIFAIAINSLRDVKLRGFSVAIEGVGLVGQYDIEDGMIDNGVATIRVPIECFIQNEEDRSEEMRLRSLSDLKIHVSAWTSDYQALYLSPPDQSRSFFSSRL
jgi:SAM-dependent methyltransferase